MIFSGYFPSLGRKLIVRWLCFTPPLHFVGCDMALKVICSPEFACFETNIPRAQIKRQTIPPEASLRFARTLSISQIWSTLAGNMLNALSAKRNYATRTNWNLTINNITQYRWIKGYYPMGFYHLPAGITLSHHGLTTVDAPEWPSTSCQLMSYS